MCRLQTDRQTDLRFARQRAQLSRELSHIEVAGQEATAARVQVTRQAISPVLLGARDLAEANESADLADVKLESPV